MAAEALEQSALEGKDKDQLLQIAKALGMKGTSRLKKAEIIDRILDSTGASGGGPASGNGAADRPGSTNGDGAPAPVAAQQSGGESTPSAPREGATSGSAERAPSGSPGAGPDGEPLADWEREISSQGDTGAGAAGGDERHGDGRQDRREREGQGGPDDRGRGGGPESRQDDRQGGDRSANRQGDQQGGNQQNRQGGNQQGGNQQGNRDKQGGGSQQGNRDKQGGGSQQGEGSSRRRRRRRKNRGGQEGPQGEDVELLDDEGQPQSNEPVEVDGYVDLRDEGYGFLRINGYLPSKQDAYVPVKLARQFGLRKGDRLTGTMRPAGRNEKNPALLEIRSVNGGDPEKAKRRPRFEDLTALFPDEKLSLEDPSDPTNMTARIIDLVSPIGKGQRGIIVSPPKAGKTTVMKTIARSIEKNNPEVELIVLLIDERPEEVTDMRRTVAGEVIASTFDRPSDEHTHVAEMAIAKAKRRVEEGKDVVIMLDGITRLSRAYNLAAPASGRILSGGIDAGALYPPKKFFGAARNCEEGGSLTILATALVDTNSRMDEAIFEEFKGTGNMELRLDRKVAERRIYPAIDVDASSTRHEELLFDRKQLQMVWKLRRVLSGLAADGNAAPGLELLIDRLKTFRTNAEFLSEIAKQPGM